MIEEVIEYNYITMTEYGIEVITKRFETFDQTLQEEKLSNDLRVFDRDETVC